ncbi:hypothetical protein RDI58_015142 [Solanum bulbocastanum]|uniref:Uncharacterized protein n=1 Tax=Solanum bulbocastanum TaxID=147425 RepID=A0AAN8TJY8_SOLBU
MEGNNLFSNLPTSNPTAKSTNNRYYKSHSIDLQSSHLNSHSISTNISLSFCNNAETNNPLEQKKIPTISFSSSQPYSIKHEQLLPDSSTSCTTPYGGGNTTSSSPPLNTILDRVQVERLSCLLFNGHKWGEHHDNHPKPQLLGPTYHGGHETGHGQLCEPLLYGKCVESTGTGCSTNFLPHHPPTVESAATLQPSCEYDSFSPAPPFHSPGGHSVQPTLLPMDSCTTTWACTTISQSSSDGNTSTTSMAVWERDVGSRTERFLHQNLNSQTRCSNYIPGERGQEVCSHMSSDLG